MNTRISSRVIVLASAITASLFRTASAQEAAEVPVVDWNSPHIMLDFGTIPGLGAEGWIPGSSFAESGMDFFGFIGIADPAGTNNAATAIVYGTCRHRDISTEPLSFVFPDLPDGPYLLRLHFTDVFGERAIDVAVEGTKVLENIDPITDAGGILKPLIKEVDATVSGGLEIVLDDDRSGVGVKDVFLCGLEIIKSGAVKSAAPVIPRSRQHVSTRCANRTPHHALCAGFGRDSRFPVIDIAGRAHRNAGAPRITLPEY